MPGKTGKKQAVARRAASAKTKPSVPKGKSSAKNVVAMKKKTRTTVAARGKTRSQVQEEIIMDDDANEVEEKVETPEIAVTKKKNWLPTIGKIALGTTGAVGIGAAGVAASKYYQKQKPKAPEEMNKVIPLPSLNGDLKQKPLTVKNYNQKKEEKSSNSQQLMSKDSNTGNHSSDQCPVSSVQRPVSGVQLYNGNHSSDQCPVLN